MTRHIDPGFEGRFRGFIDLANSHLATTEPANVSLSLNEAAARYHAWVWAKMAPSPQAFADKKADATAYFLDQCRAMFEAHYDDYVRTYDQHFPSEAQKDSPPA